MDWLQTVVLALVQGLTEFLPVSSSAHLILVPILTGWEDQGLAFDVALHFGSLSAVLIYFRREILSLSSNWLRSLPGISATMDSKQDAEARLAWAVILGTIPVGLLGFIFEEQIATVLRSPLYLATGLILFGLVLAWADYKHKGIRDEYTLGWKEVLFIGCAQAVSLFPGTSRSGITMTAGLMLGLNRQSAARFSFLLSIPVIFVACFLETAQLLETGESVAWVPILTGTLLSGLSAYLCIHYFLAFIQRVGMLPFVIYRIVLGVFLLWLFL